MDTCISPAPPSPAMQEQQVLATASRVREELLTQGVDTVSVDYDGMDGAGRIENIAYSDSLKPGTILSPDAEVQERTEALLMAVIDLRHPGWRECDGAFGSFEWMLDHETLEHRHSRRCMSYDEFYHEGFEADLCNGTLRQP